MAAATRPHLAGSEISLPARIVAVADTLDAMASHRPYHPALDLRAALAELRHGSGSLYDPDVCAAALLVACADGRPPMSDSDWERRDELALLRDDRAAERDELAVLRAHASEGRSRKAAVRDDGAGKRESDLTQQTVDLAVMHAAGVARDVEADQRDREAEERNFAARQFEKSGGIGSDPEALGRSEEARQEAAGDRRQAARDRRMRVVDLTHAELARGQALAHAESSHEDVAANIPDRDSLDADLRVAVDDRVLHASDRAFAAADREAATAERGKASLDNLTGVYLRGPGLIELHREVARARRTKVPFTLAFIDIDQLKAVNDAGGHSAGDRLIRAVANTLKLKLRPYDVIARLGGDEFVCGLTGLDLAGARRRLADVNTALAAAFHGGSVTVGIAELAADDTIARLIGRADADRYQRRAASR